MIEIIKRGAKTITECKMCGCKFSYESEDIMDESLIPMVGKQFVICPQCDKKVIITQTR